MATGAALRLSSCLGVCGCRLLPRLGVLTPSPQDWTLRSTSSRGRFWEWRTILELCRLGWRTKSRRSRPLSKVCRAERAHSCPAVYARLDSTADPAVGSATHHVRRSRDDSLLHVLEIRRSAVAVPSVRHTRQSPIKRLAGRLRADGRGAQAAVYPSRRHRPTVGSRLLRGPGSRACGGPGTRLEGEGNAEDRSDRWWPAGELLPGQCWAT